MCTSCPTFSSTDIFLTRFSAKSQDFFEGANGCDVGDAETRRRGDREVSTTCGSGWVLSPARRVDATSDKLCDSNTETVRKHVTRLLILVTFCNFEIPVFSDLFFVRVISRGFVVSV